MTLPAAEGTRQRCREGELNLAAISCPYVGVCPLCLSFLMRHSREYHDSCKLAGIYDVVRFGGLDVIASSSVVGSGRDYNQNFHVTKRDLCSELPDIRQGVIAFPCSFKYQFFLSLDNKVRRTSKCGSALACSVRPVALVVRLTLRQHILWPSSPHFLLNLPLLPLCFCQESTKLSRRLASMMNAFLCSITLDPSLRHVVVFSLPSSLFVAYFATL